MPQVLSDLGAHFKIGQPVRAAVISLDSKSSRLDLSLKIVPDGSKKKKKVATADFSAGVSHHAALLSKMGRIQWQRVKLQVRSSLQEFQRF